MRFSSIYKTLRHALAATCSAAIAISAMTSCEDNVPTVGGQLASGEVQIALDSLVWNGTDQYVHRGENSTLINVPKLSFRSVRAEGIDTRSTTNLLGRLSVPEYGDLRCSFVSRLMCTKSLSIPDSIPVEQIDSMLLILSVPRGQLTGDSLAPQQLRVYRLNKPLPDNIDNTFDPTGYYDPESPIGSRSYTLSALGMNDSLYSHLSYINIDIPMSRQMAVDTYNAYRNNLNIFQWPSTFEQYFPGIYVEPSFGRGCVANIEATTFLLFYNYSVKESVTGSDGVPKVEVVKKSGVTGVFETSPIVLNSNNITYTPSAGLQAMADAGEAIITTPGCYRVKFNFPAEKLIEIYKLSQSKLSVVSSLSLTIPAEEIPNDYGITPPPYLVMVRSSHLDEFLANNELPDSKNSFYASYDKSTGSYVFGSLRNYIIEMIENGVKENDTEFTIIPVNLTLEEVEDQSSYSLYYGTSSSKTMEVTKCTPYISGPTMCRLRMDKALSVFSYSVQQMK